MDLRKLTEIVADGLFALGGEDFELLSTDRTADGEIEVEAVAYDEDGERLAVDFTIVLRDLDVYEDEDDEYEHFDLRADDDEGDED